MQVNKQFGKNGYENPLVETRRALLRAGVPLVQTEAEARAGRTPRAHLQWANAQLEKLVIEHPDLSPSEVW